MYNTKGKVKKEKSSNLVKKIDLEKWEIITEEGSFTCDICGNTISYSRFGPRIFLDSEKSRIEKTFPEGSYICGKCGHDNWLNKYFITKRNLAVKIKKKMNKIIDSIFNFKIQNILFWRAR